MTILGSFVVGFDFDDCGGDGLNFCQAAITQNNASIDKISCTPELVSDVKTGGSHCVTYPINAESISTSVEGDIGTLQHALNSLKDDNNIEFMNVNGMPFKQTGVSVTRKGRIKSKGGCAASDTEGVPSSCAGSYELYYVIEFDAPHTSGDVPELTVMHSNLRINQSSHAYLSMICPESEFQHGCAIPVGRALNITFGNFYDGAYLTSAMEQIKGSQPSGTISLDYECESEVVVMKNGSMTTTNTTGSFTDTKYVSEISPGQFIRFSNTPGLDHYRKILSVDKINGLITFDDIAPMNITYNDVEYGDYFSDWSELDGSSGISDICRSSRIHSTLPIDISMGSDVSSTSDWLSKIRGLSVIDSTGIHVNRILSDLSIEVGYIWRVTFDKQPGSVNEMTCNTLSGVNFCDVSTFNNSSFLSGSYRLKTTWPHEYEASNPIEYSSDNLAWNIDADTLGEKLERVKEGSDMVFGEVSVSRSPYIPAFHSRWSGGYIWTITFTSRGGNIPAMNIDLSSLVGIQSNGEVSDEDSGQYDTYQGITNNNEFLFDDPGTARDGNQISGTYALSWEGNDLFPFISTQSIFRIQSGGNGTNQFTALSPHDLYELLTDHIFGKKENIISVSRSEKPSQVMGYTYSIIFKHEDVGGDIASFKPSISGLFGTNPDVEVVERVKGNSILGSFQLRFDGETTRPIPHNASGQEVENALNELISISPSVVKVTRSDVIKTGPADGTSGLSTQVGGYVWSVTFSSNVWRDPTVVHNSSFVPGNWMGDPVGYFDLWDSGFSKAWGKNVGNVGMIECIPTGLYTSYGVFPADGCTVDELIQGTDPLGGFFKVCLDTSNNITSSISVSQSVCSDYIGHNAPASAAESYYDGSSMEEKLESMSNIGDVEVTRGDVNARNGGYTWTVTFLSDVDGTCEQRDDINGFCNSPGNIPKICHSDSSLICDSSSLTGSCSQPDVCTKITVLDESDFLSGRRPPASNEIQQLIVKDNAYLGWAGGSIVSTSSFSEYKLNISGTLTSCIRHNSTALDMKLSIQEALDNGIGGRIDVVRHRSEHMAPNGFLYILKFFETGDIPTSIPVFSHDESICSHGFLNAQEVSVVSLVDGSWHPTTCENCKDGIIQRGNFSLFEVDGDSISGSLPWNVNVTMLKAHLESNGRSVQIERKVLDKYGSIEWLVTFVFNPGMTPPGSGDIKMLRVEQEPDTMGRSHPVSVQEVRKGSLGLSGSFSLDFGAASGPVQISYEESDRAMAYKLNQLETLGSVFVVRAPFPSNSTGGWGGEAVSINGEIGGFQWNIFFVKNLGSTDGYSFPPGSGNIVTPGVNFDRLNGNEAFVGISTLQDGSDSLSGEFKLKWMNEETSLISYYASSLEMKQAIDGIESLGSVSVDSFISTGEKIPGITVTAFRDHSLIHIEGNDVRTYLAPGDTFRVGGDLFSSESGNGIFADGGKLLGSVDVFHGSPLLNVTEGEKLDLNVFEQIRLSGDVYSIVRNGIEIQQLVVYRHKSIANSPFYKLTVQINGLSQSTSCIYFDASADDLAYSLNNLTNVGENSIYVTRSQDSNGFIGNAHYYRIYFQVTRNSGNVNEMVVEYCSGEILSSINSTNAHVAIKTIVEGGSIEHQRIILASDSGSLEPVSAFNVKFTDQHANVFETGCIEWGEPILGLEQIAMMSITSPTVKVGAGGATKINDNIYDLHISSFIEGVVDVGDQVQLDGHCSGKVKSIGSDGQTARIESYLPYCSLNIGDDLKVFPDLKIIETFSGKRSSSFSLHSITMFSDSPVVEKFSEFFKIRVTFNGESKTTTCLPYNMTEALLQDEIGLLFDFDQNGLIDLMDVKHISVTKHGDGSLSWAYGYVYYIESSGKQNHHALICLYYFRTSDLRHCHLNRIIYSIWVKWCYR